jgi:hypothetical protein
MCGVQIYQTHRCTKPVRKPDEATKQAGLALCRQALAQAQQAATAPAQGTLDLELEVR